MGYSALGLLVLLLELYVLYLIFTSSMDGTKKVVWLIVVLFLPLLGAILFLAIGQKGSA